MATPSLENRGTFVESNWQKTSIFGARKKLHIDVTNDGNVKMIMVTQSAFQRLKEAIASLLSNNNFKSESDEVELQNYSMRLPSDNRIHQQVMQKFFEQIQQLVDEKKGQDTDLIQKEVIKAIIKENTDSKRQLWDIANPSEKREKERATQTVDETANAVPAQSNIAKTAKKSVTWRDSVKTGEEGSDGGNGTSLRDFAPDPAYFEEESQGIEEGNEKRTVIIPAPPSEIEPAVSEIQPQAYDSEVVKPSITNVQQQTEPEPIKPDPIKIGLKQLKDGVAKLQWKIAQLIKPQNTNDQLIEELFLNRIDKYYKILVELDKCKDVDKFNRAKSAIENDLKLDGLLATCLNVRLFEEAFDLLQKSFEKLANVDKDTPVRELTMEELRNICEQEKNDEFNKSFASLEESLAQRREVYQMMEKELYLDVSPLARDIFHSITSRYAISYTSDMTLYEIGQEVEKTKNGLRQAIQLNQDLYHPHLRLVMKFYGPLLESFKDKIYGKKHELNIGLKTAEDVISDEDMSLLDIGTAKDYEEFRNWVDLELYNALPNLVKKLPQTAIDRMQKARKIRKDLNDKMFAGIVKIEGIEKRRTPSFESEILTAKEKYKSQGNVRAVQELDAMHDRLKQIGTTYTKGRWPLAVSKNVEELRLEELVEYAESVNKFLAKEDKRLSELELIY